MPSNDYIPADEYTLWADAADEGVIDLYHGGIAMVGGIWIIVWDPNQDSVIYPPAPKKILPPTGNPHVQPPRVKRVKVPAPTY